MPWSNGAVLARAASCLGLLLFPAMAEAQDYRAGPDSYHRTLPHLQAGDHLQLDAGDYLRGLPLQHLLGRVGQPIVVEGPEHGPGARFIARPGANTVSLVDVDYVVIRNLELDGRNIPVDAVKAEGHARFAHHVTLEHLYIHDHAASQQNVGISTKCPAFGWVIRGNRIERVGTGMYLGNSDGYRPFVAGLIEDNRVSDTIGYNIEIKHQKSRPADMPEADLRHDTVIRHNFFSKAGAQPNPMARPNVLVGHFPPAGEGSGDRYLIYGNLFWQNPGESLFQGEGNVALYNNVFVTQGPDAVRIQPHNDVPREVRILHNTVLAANHGITVRVPEINPYLQAVAGNAVFAARPIEGGVQEANQTGSHDRAGRFLTDPDAPLDRIDLTPRPGRVAAGEVRPAWLEALPDAGLDFSGHRREGDGIGAYGQAGAEPLSSWLGRGGFTAEGM